MLNSEIIPHSAIRIPRFFLMPMAMMDVRIVRVSVGQILVVMDVGMWLAGRIGWLVDVLVMFVVRVEMVVCHCLVAVRVGVALGEMEPYADRHQTARNPEERRRLLM
jgi:hypothetical protein